MRIIAGTAKGRKLSSPGGTGTRPTSDRVRESIFSIVGDLVKGARVLDLYSGTGAMGLEALSRGARYVVFIEKDPTAVKCLNKNIELCGFKGRTEVVRQHVISYLSGADPRKDFEIIFADPPYSGDLGRLTLKALSKNAKSLQRCLIVLEHAPDRPPDPVPENMNRVDARKYGSTGVTFFQFNETKGV